VIHWSHDGVAHLVGKLNCKLQQTRCLAYMWYFRYMVVSRRRLRYMIAGGNALAPPSDYEGVQPGAGAQVVAKKPALSTL